MRHQTQISSLLKEEDLRNEISNLTKSEEIYYQRINAKLNDPSLSNKAYWSILKTFQNGKKVPIISPLFNNNKFVTDCQEKANVFNSFFTKQCSPIPSKSVSPAKIPYMAKDRIKTICFGESDVIKLIKALNVSKVHGHDGISVKMIKIGADSIAHPLTVIFQNHLLQVFLPTIGKKLTLLQFIKKKKNDKQTVSNYRSVSLLSICSKTFQKLIFNNSLPFMRRETCYLNINLVFVLVILVFTSCLKLHMTFFLVLTLLLLWKTVEYSQTYQKPSIGYGTTACCLN